MKPLTKRVIVFNGSLREHGNTDALVASFIEGINAAGLSVRSVVLRELALHDCVGCCQCQRDGACNFEDDMTHMRDMIIKSDILVFARSAPRGNSII